MEDLALGLVGYGIACLLLYILLAIMSLVFRAISWLERRNDE